MLDSKKALGIPRITSRIPQVLWTNLEESSWPTPTTLTQQLEIASEK
jgi:hypothetical protein